MDVDLISELGLNALKQKEGETIVCFSILANYELLRKALKVFLTTQGFAEAENLPLVRDSDQEAWTVVRSKPNAGYQKALPLWYGKTFYTDPDDEDGEIPF